jgi:hypothetical protein
MSSGLIILIGFIVSTIFALIVWFLSKNVQKKNQMQTDIGKQKAEIIALIEDAIEAHPIGTDETNNTSQGRDKQGWPTWEKWLMGLSLLPLIASFVFAGVYDQSPKPTLSSITIAPASPSNLPVGAAQTFVASGNYSDGLSGVDISSQVTWTSSNQMVSSVSVTGLATGLTVGSTHITATLSGVTSQSVTMTVVTATSIPTLTSIHITPSAPGDLSVGSTQQFSVSEVYSDGSAKSPSGIETVTWTSSNPSIVYISSSGLATGITVGIVNITAFVSGKTSNPESIRVVIFATLPTLTSIHITPAAPASLSVGSNQQFTAIGSYSDGSTENLTNIASWGGSNNAIATVSSTGLAYGTASGTINITASYEGIISQVVSMAVIAPTTPNPPVTVPISNVSLAVTPPTISTAATYIVSFALGVTQSASATAIVLTFPTGANIAGVNVATIQTSAGLGTNAIPAQTIAIAISGQNLTIKTNAATGVFPAAIGAGAIVQITVSGVINPAVIGSYSVSVQTAAQPTPVASNSIITTTPIKIQSVTLPSGVRTSSGIIVTTYPTTFRLVNSASVDVTVTWQVNFSANGNPYSNYSDSVTVPKNGYIDVTNRYYYPIAGTWNVTYTISFNGSQLDTWSGTMNVLQ